MPSFLSVRELLDRLVAFDTTSHRTNLPLLDFVSDYLDLPGVRLTRHEAPEEPKATLVVELGPEVDPDTRDGLILSGHTDVVPADEEGWSSDPFTVDERDERLYGRGAADMKGFLALAVDLAARVDPGRLVEPLVLIFTYDEELGTLGAAHFHDTWPEDRSLPRRAVIGEPTELEVVRLHKGHLKARWEIFGEPAHSAYPHLGVNAIEPAGKLVVALAALARDLEDERLPSSEHFSEVPHPTLTVARIRGGTAINVVPDRCTVEIGMRLLPGMDVATAIGRLEALGLRSLEGIEHEFPRPSLSPPLETPAESSIVRTLLAIAGQEDPDRAVMFATDAGWLGKMGIECVIWGPGSIEVAHRPDEHVPVDHLERAREDLKTLIHRTILKVA